MSKSTLITELQQEEENDDLVQQVLDEVELSKNISERNYDVKDIQINNNIPKNIVMNADAKKL